MDYKVLKDRIIISQSEDFDIRAICECGQMFRYYPLGGGDYEVISGRNIATVRQNGDRIEIETSAPAAFEEFFDLREDYGAFKRELLKYPILKDAIEFGKGIRIARGEAEENIFFFLISQNNNISRIQKIIEKMSEIGEPIDANHRAFPSAKALSEQPFEWFKGLGAGYRDVYLFEAARLLAKTDLEEIKALDDQALYKWLRAIKGVGDKVASCIMLFGFHRTGCFPVDTWIEKVYKEYFFDGEKTRTQISQYLQAKFGIMSGITQQYLFYYQRSQGKNKQ